MEPPMVIVSKSEPDEACPRLSSYGLNAIPGEAGTDYVWYPHGKVFGIERKTVSNLLGSLKDRQLVQQAHRGVAEFDRYFVLIEGDTRQGRGGKYEFHSPRHPEADRDGWVESGWVYDAIDGMLLDLNLLGVFILHCPMFEYARKIAQVVNSTHAETKKFIREQQRPDLPATAALGGEMYKNSLWALCALDGCGPKVAEALLSEYKSLAVVIESLDHYSKSVAKVKLGKRTIGKALAERLHAAVTEV